MKILNKFKIISLALILSSASLLSQTFGGGSGTYYDPYLISNKAHWDELVYWVNVEGESFKADNFKLTDNIGSRVDPVTETVGTDNQYEWFAGHLDGGNYTITVNISSSNMYVGLFAQLGEGSSIVNLNVIGQIQPTNSIYVGAIVGYDWGSNIDNCHNFAEINGIATHTGGVVGFTAGNIHNCSNNAQIQIFGTYCYIGGLVGIISNTIHNCINNGQISGTGDCVYAGGVAGQASNMNECINNGSIQITGDYCCIGGIVVETYTIHNCTNNAKIQMSGDYCYIGGVARYGTNIYNCNNFAEIKATSNSNVGGIVTFAACTVSYCINRGSIEVDLSNNLLLPIFSIGGIVSIAYPGIPDLFIEDCFNYGDIIGNDNIGGMLGLGTASITDCFNYGDIIGNDCIGGIVGARSSVGGVSISGCFNNGMLIGNSNVSGMIGCP